MFLFDIIFNNDVVDHEKKESSEKIIYIPLNMWYKFTCEKNENLWKILFLLIDDMVLIFMFKNMIFMFLWYLIIIKWY